MESILNSVKKVLGLPQDYTVFDPDLVIHINSVFMILNQMGVGPEEGFGISDASAVWTDFLASCPGLEAVKSYVVLKVRLLFDPPQSSVTMDAIKNQIAELEWRMYSLCDK